MSRVAEHYALGSTQSGLDFVDVDLDTDVPVYIDPAALRAQSGDWAESSIESIQSYFAVLIEAIRNDDEARIRELILPLREPNETHLGMSRGKSRGNSLGSAKKAQELIDNLRESKAAKSGFLSDLDDTALFVKGVDRDVISDITTCIIRRHLIEYTQAQCTFHGIDMEQQDSGPMWDSVNEVWTDAFVDLPRANDQPLLLVPKSIVRLRLSVDKGKYYRGYLRPYFEDAELGKARSDFVKIVTDSRTKTRVRKVKKKELDQHLGTTKPDIESHTEKYPAALDDYKTAMRGNTEAPLPDQDFHSNIATETESLQDIFAEIRSVKSGRSGANNYHHSVAKFLTCLFDTQLGNEKIETKLHNGLKFIDITYDNVASGGFFDWLRKNYSAALIVVECKNYGKDVKNPEFDQIGMRFSPRRGEVGLLVCRELADVDAARARAKAIADDGHGYVIVLTDEDLQALATTAQQAVGRAKYDYPLLRQRFDELLGL